MGKNNKARRAAKARRRAAQASQRPAGGPPQRWAMRSNPHNPANGTTTPPDMWAELEHKLCRSLAAIWSGGWQPAELVREVRRSRTGPRAVELLRRLIAVDHARRAPCTLHPVWLAQIEAMNLPPAQPASGWLAEPNGDDAPRWLADAQLLHAVLASLGRILRLLPPPGCSAHDVDIAGAHSTTAASDPVLERVRALLAQAESTNYPAEAEAFTAKSHELMTRHAIDAAMVSSTSRCWVSAVRIAIDDAYVDTKSLLLQIVARSSRCRAVFDSRYAMSTVIGAGDDLAGVQLLFTSLLLQAQQALLAEGDAVPAGARQRSRAYRTSFLFAFAHRIGERLAAVSASTAADVESATGAPVLPVLAERLEVVDQTIDDVFGPLTQSRVSAGWDAIGWQSGRTAADRARLANSDLPSTGSPLALSA